MRDGQGEKGVVKEGGICDIAFRGNGRNCSLSYSLLKAKRSQYRKMFYCAQGLGLEAAVVFRAKNTLTM